LKNKRPTWCHLLFYFTSYVLNMFRILIYTSSGACDCAIELPNWSFCSWCLCVGDLVRLVLSSVRVAGFSLKHGHQISNTQRTKNKTTDVVIQQHNRKLLMMDILISDTCWVHNKWNKIASNIKLVFYSSTIYSTFPIATWNDALAMVFEIINTNKIEEFYICCKTN